jgi:putative membrane protein
MMGWYGGGMGYGAWMFMGLFWLVLLTVIIWAVVRLLPARRDGAGRGDQDSPEDILDRRFARGEIDAETYQAQRALLANARGPRGGQR